MSHIWMPLYVGDYLADTRRLTTEQHGAYFLLLMEYWQKSAPLPDDDDQLAQITGLGRKWKACRAVLAQFFRVEGGAWHHKRVDLELSNTAENIAKMQKKLAAMNAAKAKSRPPCSDSTRPPCSDSARPHDEASTRALPSPSPVLQHTPTAGAGDVQVSAKPPPSLAEVLAAADRLKIPAEEAADWFNRKAAPENHAHGFGKVLDWEYDLQRWWRKRAPAAAADVAESSAPPRPARTETPAAMVWGWKGQRALLVQRLKDERPDAVDWELRRELRVVEKKLRDIVVDGAQPWMLSTKLEALERYRVEHPGNAESAASDGEMVAPDPEYVALLAEIKKTREAMVRVEKEAA